MSEHDHTNGSKKDKVQGLDLSLELNFVPDWARKPPESTYFNYKPEKERRGRPQRRKGPHSDRRRPEGERNRPKRRPPDAHRRDHQPARKQESHVEIPPVTVRFLPQSRAISEIIKKLKSSHRAHPLLQTASLFLANPESCSARIEINKGVQNLNILQCRVCGMVDMNEDTLKRHIANEHLNDFMDSTQETSDPPAGNFPCVAKCGLSGKLLGPPNHHSYTEKVQELHHHSFSHMSMEEYEAHIITLHDDEAVEKWKQEYCERKTFLPRNSQETKPMSLVKAEAWLFREIAPAQIQKTRRATLPVPLSRSIDDRGLLLAVKNGWLKEHRFPSSLMMALRGAFLNKGLHLFKAGSGKGITFVTPISPQPIDLEFVVDSIKEVMIFLDNHPGSSRKELVRALRPDAAQDSDQVKEILSPLSWLIERGHLIEFFDGTLSLPLKKRAKGSV